MKFSLFIALMGILMMLLVVIYQNFYQFHTGTFGLIPLGLFIISLCKYYWIDKCRKDEEEAP